MELNKFRKAVLILTASLAIGCSMPNFNPEITGNSDVTGSLERALTKKYATIVQQYKTGNIPVVKTNDIVTLQWENGSSNIEVNYRQRFTQNWISLGAPTRINPTGTSESDVSGIAPGIYEFSVYDHDPQVNVMRTSLDQYAQPAAGWFLMYKKSPEADTSLDGKISDSEMKSFIDSWLRKKFTNQQLSVNADYYLSPQNR